MAKNEKTILENVVDEAWSNPAFKASLIESPVEAISALTGKKVKLPEGKNRLVVSDQSDPTTAYFNIPVQVDMEDAELTEEQLEIVAGGRASMNPSFNSGAFIWPPVKGCFPPFQVDVASVNTDR